MPHFVYIIIVFRKVIIHWSNSRCGSEFVILYYKATKFTKNRIPFIITFTEQLFKLKICFSNNTGKILTALAAGVAARTILRVFVCAC